ncbi:MAG TPA: thioredoxin-dependent thiol peroxidase [Alphaproteobacteria bacterium]
MILTVGQEAPDFTLPVMNWDAQEISLKKLRGQPVVVYFYPKDDTPGCTTEACDFRDRINSVEKLDAVVIGISKDSVASHQKFAEKFGLDFPLASDTDGKICEAYGVWVEKSMYGRKYMGIERATFLIKPDGTIGHIWRKVSVTNHVRDVAKAIKALSDPELKQEVKQAVKAKKETRLKKENDFA